MIFFLKKIETFSFLLMKELILDIFVRIDIQKTLDSVLSLMELMDNIEGCQFELDKSLRQLEQDLLLKEVSRTLIINRLRLGRILETLKSDFDNSSTLLDNLVQTLTLSEDDANNFPIQKQIWGK